MSDIVIQAEGLGKKYLIGHQTERERYTALRDVLARNVRDYWRKAKALAHGNPIVQGDEQEEIWALRDVSFEIRRGEAVGIIGRNGAGKSTLLKILSRITEPSAGRVTIRGRVASLLEVGTGFHPELTGRENIYLNGAILGMSRQEIKRKFDEIVDFAEVEKFLDTPVKRYSSGMYVRLAFAVAAHLEPEILVVDEVLAVGDAEFQKKCLSKMSEVGQKGRTVLFVSHNISAVRTLCNRSIILQGGYINFDGSVIHGINQYLSSNSNKNLVERSWLNNEITAPQNRSTRIRSVKLCSEDSKILTTITTATTIRVEIEFQTLIDSATTGLTLVIYNSDGTCIFSSINNRDKAYRQSLSRGIYCSSCIIPKNFFNNGQYSLSIILFGSNFTDEHFEKDILYFVIHDSEEIRGDYHGKFDGCIRPDLVWQTTKPMVLV